MVDNFDRQLRRYSREVQEAIRREEADAGFRTGRTSFRFSRDKGLEFLPSSGGTNESKYGR